MKRDTLKKQIRLPDGSYIPKLGQGTWGMGEDDEKYEKEINALQHGIGIGMTMLDTAEVYADGKSENIIGNAIQNFDRKTLYIISKVHPDNASKKHIYSSLEKSLKLLNTDYLDMYLLHWRGNSDLAEVVYCMENLKDQSKIKCWGVSGFDTEDMEELWKVPDGNKCCVNQVLYNLATRGIEYDLMPWQREKQVPIIAYGPVGRAGNLITKAGISKAKIVNDRNVKEVADKKGISVIQLLLSFVLRYDDVIAIPKAVNIKHVDENATAGAVTLNDDDIEQLSLSFPAPSKKVPLERY